MNRLARLWMSVARSPVLWGTLVSVGFFSVLHSNALLQLPNGQGWKDFFIRYTAGHEIEYVECWLFFICVAALLFKALDVAAQRRLLADPLLGNSPAEAQSPQEAAPLLARLDALSLAAKDSYLVRRLRAVLEHVLRTDSSDSLDDQLKHHSDLDADRSHGNYAFERFLIWAIPIMGFLGTVVGITMALASLKPEDLAGSMPGMTHGLGVAFDTTALALVLATILMFAQFQVARWEGNLLENVDRRANDLLIGRFGVVPTGGDPHLAAVRRMSDAVIRAVERAVDRQAELWQSTITAAQLQWDQAASAAVAKTEESLCATLDTAVKSHARDLADSVESSQAESKKLWLAVQQSLDRASEATMLSFRELAKHGDGLRQVLAATGDVVRIEDALNRNLAALSGSQNFEATVQSLAAVIHLLNARLGQSPALPAGKPDKLHLGQAA